MFSLANLVEKHNFLVHGVRSPFCVRFSALVNYFGYIHNCSALDFRVFSLISCIVYIFVNTLLLFAVSDDVCYFYESVCFCCESFRCAANARAHVCVCGVWCLFFFIQFQYYGSWKSLKWPFNNWIFSTWLGYLCVHVYVCVSVGLYITLVRF